MFKGQFSKSLYNNHVSIPGLVINVKLHAQGSLFFFSFFMLNLSPMDRVPSLRLDIFWCSMIPNSIKY